MVNSGEFGARNDGATPISNRRATSDDVPNFSSIDYKSLPLIYPLILIMARRNITHLLIYGIYLAIQI
nr:palindromic element RPE2 domain-containing protein [Rickettsia endosymbiont of Culicoides newsteadi]